ncbi:MAG: VCBS repeat-containing protein [Candidatus Latescibacteria bacterium]|nr:VCBS repeat-containing protein [Candidatus Latescibacterota bacterium]
MKPAKILLLGAALLAWPLGLAAQTFQNQTEASGTLNNGLYGTGLAWGDFDSDGDQDLYVTNWATAVSVPKNALYRNEGSGAFTDVAAAMGVEVVSNSSAAAWGDYDNDGDLDLYVADFFDQDYLYQNNGDTFAEVGRTQAGIDVERRGSTTSVAWGDYNNDGWLDFYLGEYYYNNELYQNAGDGTFDQIVDLGVNDRRDADDVSWADYDNDGDLDLYVVNRQQENVLFRNDLSGGTPAFVALAASPVADKGIGQAAAWGDYDNDGDLDLYVGNVGANALYRNEGSDTFAEVGAQAGVRQNNGVGWLTAGVGWADYDGNGYLDLLLANGADRQSQPVVLLANQGDGTFSNATTGAGLSAVRGFYAGVGWADYDGNGSPDFYLANGATLGSRLLQNDAAVQGYIKVRVKGKTHRDAIGAVVRLLDAATGALQAYRQVLSGPGSLELIFGAPAGPYQVEVRFPGSATAVVKDAVQAGDQLDIEEP